jgi:hypothetical protein
MGFATFLLRFIGYAIVMAIAYGIANFFWAQNGLDFVDTVQGLHSLAVVVVGVAPLILALVAIVARPVAVFLLFYIAGAIVTAPFALARLVS